VGLFTSLTLLDLCGNQLTKLRGRGLKQLQHLRSLSLSHNLLTDAWELLPILALPAITFLAIAPQRLPKDHLTRAGPPGSPGALYRRLAILLTLHSIGSEERAGLNFLDRCRLAQRLPLDAPPSTWQPVSIDERLQALEELYLHMCGATAQAVPQPHPPTSLLLPATSLAVRGQAPVERAGLRNADGAADTVAHNVWAGADAGWLELRQYILGQLARSASQLTARRSSVCPNHTAPQSRNHIQRPAPMSPPPARTREEQMQRWLDEERQVVFLKRLNTRRSQTSASYHTLTHIHDGADFWGFNQRACLFSTLGQSVVLDESSLAHVSLLSLRYSG
jgi:hypothetical protein